MGSNPTLSAIFKYFSQLIIYVKIISAVAVPSVAMKKFLLLSTISSLVFSCSGSDKVVSCNGVNTPNETFVIQGGKIFLSDGFVFKITSNSESKVKGKAKTYSSKVRLVMNLRSGDAQIITTNENGVYVRNYNNCS